MTVQKGTWWVVRVLAVSILVALLLLSDACAQSLAASGQVSTSAWASHDRCYQHTMAAGGVVGIRLGPIYTEAFLSAVWWGACDAKIPASILNAEAGRVVERSHGITSALKIWKNVYRKKSGVVVVQKITAGLTVRRRAVHHIWRNKAEIRKNGFPESGSAETARNRCRSGERCPTIGYHDYVRPMLVYDGGRLSMELLGPGWQWKSLTLPHAAVIGSVTYETGEWAVDVQGAAGGLREPVLDLGARVRVAQSVWAQTRYGTVHAPGWKGPLRRLAAGLVLMM